MKKNSINKKYSDVLYWATSTQTKDKGYRITRTEEAVLRKLIHYSKSKEKITYSNENIAKHTYIGIETLKKVIPSLQKKGYISIALIKIFDEGEPKTRRTIFIKWDFIQFVFDELPATEESEEPNSEQVVEIDILMTEPINEVIDATIPEETLKPVTDQKEVAPISTEVIPDDNPIPDLVITDEKLKWFKEMVNDPELTKENVENLGQKELRHIFYGERGIWNIDDYTIENQYQIKFKCRGGSKCSLYNPKKEPIEVNMKDFGYYLNLKGIKFDKFTPNLYNMVNTHGFIETPKEYSEPCHII